MKIYHTDKFAKAYRKLPDKIKDESEKKEEIFRANPFDPRLKTHRLKGTLSDQYSFSVKYSWRIVFHFESENVVFDMIGTHAIYR
jgi:mRNA-degrading endonuclease YafQ of YafQ-DinJ toxin-antitoxin module